MATIQMTMSILKNPDKINTSVTYTIIEFGEGSGKLSSDFVYIFGERLKLGNVIHSENVQDKQSNGLGALVDYKEKGPFICCTYNLVDTKRKLSAAGLIYRKDYYFAEDFFCLLDDWKKQRIAYKTYSGGLISKLKAISFGYTAKHGIVLPEDPHRNILTKRHFSRNTGPVVQRLFHALYLIPGCFESFLQIFANGNTYGNYDYICFYSVSDAIRFRKDYPDVAAKVITVEELKAHTMASLYMSAVYHDRRQNSCECNTPFNTIWVGRSGTTRICDCPDYLDVSCGNIGVTDTFDVWNSSVARILRLSVINNTYTFCSRTQCGKLAGGAEQPSLLKRRNTEETDCPSKINIANDYACNLHCPSCRKKIYAVNDDGAKTEINACIEALNSSGWLDKAEQLIVGGGGETFLSTNYKRIIYGGETKRKSILIMTNGTLFTPEEWKRLEGKYEHIGFMVSVDAATKETYDKVRCGGNFDRLMSNMDFLSKLREKNEVNKVIVIMIVQKANYAEIPDFIYWTKNKGFDGVNLSHIRNWGTYKDNYFYENVSMFDRNGKMKSELVKMLENPICKDSIVKVSWKP